VPTRIQDIEQRLWRAADELRANSKLSSQEYSVPVLGLVILSGGRRVYVARNRRISSGLPFPIKVRWQQDTVHESTSILHDQLKSASPVCYNRTVIAAPCVHRRRFMPEKGPRV
jgi:hypothetical protein